MAHHPSGVQQPSLPQLSHILPTEGDDEEFNMASVELEAGTGHKAANGAVSQQPAIIANEDKEEEDVGFELSSWV